MRASRGAAFRVAEVRQAARSWRKAGAIDAKTLEAIEAAYPEGRAHLATAWKVLIFVIVSVAANAVFFGFLSLSSAGGGRTGAWLIAAAVLAIATAFLLRRPQAGGNGSAAATSFWAAVYAIVASALVFAEGPGRNVERAETAALLTAAAVFAAACWLWGFAAYGVFAAVAFFFLLARFPGGRLWWIVAGVLLIVAAARALDHAALAPPFRRAWAGILVVSAAALYAAFNRYSLDRHLIEAVEGASTGAPVSPSATIALLSSLATAALPLLFIAWGVHERRMLVLDLGVVLAALSLVTLRFYVHIAPLWFLLLVAGAALVLTALWLNRRLRRAPGGEWAGFTARPLFRGRSVANLQAAAVAAAFAPDAAVPQDRGGFTPGGGRFGGGGATGSV